MNILSLDKQKKKKKVWVLKNYSLLSLLLLISL